MKKLIFLCCLISVIIFSAQAQNSKPKPKTTTPVNKPKTGVSKPQSPKVTTKPTTKTGTAMTKQPKQSNTTESYKTAIGLKFIYGVSITGKFFISKKGALEAIVRYNNAGGFGSNIALTGLYLQHNEINAVDGLKWYYGGGAYINRFTWDDKDVDPVSTYGPVGALGLEYKFKNLPIAISADWLPGYEINQNIGFSAQNGGLGVKYTF